MREQERFTELWVGESETTARVFARIPDGSDYRPDPKSRTAREIAWQIITEERMILEAMERGAASWDPAPAPATMQELVAVYDTQRADMAWSFLLDIVHHRGQITTYLRPMGSTVPQVYGPTADEP
jgi:uncharacterized damage-inducible protein DinB